jgi:Rhodanase C-terminal
LSSWTVSPGSKFYSSFLLLTKHFSCIEILGNPINTGGIRCERATALINQMAQVSALTSSAHQAGSSSVKNSMNNGDDEDEGGGSSLSSFKPEGVYHMRGGLDRYIKTFPSGGFWQGKNYLFDKRGEQLPENKPIEKVEDEIISAVKSSSSGSTSASSRAPTSRTGNNNSIALQHAKCCMCRCPWTTYRGKFKCQQPDCGVPVLVCDACAFTTVQQQQQQRKKIDRHSQQQHVQYDPSTKSNTFLQCELCREGYRAPQNMPDLVAMKKQAEKIVQMGNQHEDDKAKRVRSADGTDGDGKISSAKKTKIQDENRTGSTEVDTFSGSNDPTNKTITKKNFEDRRKSQNRLFLSKLPLTVRKTQIEEWVQTPVVNISWIVDKTTGSFYGSCMVELDRNSRIIKQVLNTTDVNKNMRHDLGMFPGTRHGRGDSTVGRKKKKNMGRQPKISPVYLAGNNTDEWPPDQSLQTEFPPIGFT